MSRVFFSIGLLLMVAPTVFASDGILEINQTCAVDSGCFAGDAPGFPVTITQTGSYALTSNLFNDSAGGGLPFPVTIQVDAEATIDLRGFGIRSQNAAAVQATEPTTVKNGFLVNSGGSLEQSLLELPDRSEVRDIRGQLMFTDGLAQAVIECGNGCRIENVDLDVGEASGIQCGDECLISKVVYDGNGAGGNAVTCGSGCLITGISSTGAFVVSGGAGSQLLASHIVGDSAQGSSATFALGDDSFVSGCTIRVELSGGGAASCGAGCVISDNTFVGFDQSGGGGSEELLTVGVGSRIAGNSFRNASGVAFNVGADVGYSGNVFNQNNGGNANPQVTGGTDLGGNLCGTRTTCP